ncbi:hypothetical protein E2C01_082413 [Portunus trituberculatus]|uniref:Uncharacterized protein n=1 Tax=Portunus trituberculatus TaxID=210409 RepID=A0A5B7J3S5_PORTR|nr:hypothetical protein [Portunus trituberculatus]
MVNTGHERGRCCHNHAYVNNEAAWRTARVRRMRV